MQQITGTERNFLYSLNSLHSRNKYRLNLRYFCKYINIEKDNYDELLLWSTSRDKKILESDIIDYIIHLRETRKLAPHTVSSYVNSVRHFFEMNDIIDLNWKKISKFKDKSYNSIEDRPYTREEIQLLLSSASTPREKVIILIMTSAGLRVGALPSILLKNLTPVEKYNLYQIKVYARTEAEYITFCSPECRKYIDEYLQLRKRYGERLKPDSPLIRKHFDTRESMSAVFHTEGIRVGTIRHSILALLHKSGVRLKQEQLEEGAKPKRTEIMMHHAFRKFFDTALETEGINPVYIECLMGHDQNLKTRYAKPTPSQLLEGNGDRVLGYIHGIDALTINEENRLKTKVKELTNKQDEMMLMKVKHEQDIKTMREEMHQNFSRIISIIQRNPLLSNIKPEALLSKQVEV